ncbi:unnamed protein product, partial [Tilletia laevis]
MGKRTNTFQQRVVQHGPGPLNGTFSSTQGGRTYYCFTENDPAIVLSQRGTVLELSEDEDDSMRNSAWLIQHAQQPRPRPQRLQHRPSRPQW